MSDGVAFTVRVRTQVVDGKVRLAFFRENVPGTFDPCSIQWLDMPLATARETAHQILNVVDQILAEKDA